MKKSVLIFILLTFLLSWPFGIYGYGWFQGLDDILNRYIFAGLFMLGPAVSAFLVRRFVERSGYSDVGWKLGTWRWYVGILTLCLIHWLFPS